MYVLKENGNVVSSVTGRVVGTVTEDSKHGTFCGCFAEGFQWFNTQNEALAYVTENV